jgi:hypothetical protein
MASADRLFVPNKGNIKRSLPVAGSVVASSGFLLKPDSRQPLPTTPRRTKKPKWGKATRAAVILNEIGQNLRSQGLDAVEQMKKVAKELATNLNLCNLDLRSKNIGNHGAVVLAKALETNESLSVLYLDDNGIGNVGMEAASWQAQNAAR